MWPRPLAAFVGLGIGLGAIAVASRSHAPLAEFRRQEDLVLASDPLENAPPLVALPPSPSGDSAASRRMSSG